MTKQKKQGFIAKLFKRNEKHSVGVLEQDIESPNDDSGIDVVEEHEISEQQEPKGKKSKSKEKKYKAHQADSEPLNLYVGYYANVKPKDLKEFIFNYATAHVNPIENAFYSIQPYMNGYLWEIHEGGSGKGCLKSIRTILDEQDKVTIIRDNFSVVVVKDEDKVSVSKITSSNLKYHAENCNVEFKDSMKNFVHSGFSFFISSIIFVLASTCALGGAFVNRENERTRITNDHLYKQVVELPISQMDKIKKYQKSEKSGVYVKDMGFDFNKKKWVLNVQPTPNYLAIKANVMERLDKNKPKTDDIENNSFAELNSPNGKNNKTKQDALNGLAGKG